jgi:hypothetical protein
MSGGGACRTAEFMKTIQPSYDVEATFLVTADRGKDGHIFAVQGNQPVDEYTGGKVTSFDVVGKDFEGFEVRAVYRVLKNGC